MSSIDLFGSAGLGKDQNPQPKKRKKVANETASTKNLTSSGSGDNILNKTKSTSKSKKQKATETANNATEELFDINSIWGNPIELIDDESVDEVIDTNLDVEESLDKNSSLNNTAEELVDEEIAKTDDASELVDQNSIIENPTEEIIDSILDEDIFAQIENDEDLKAENLILSSSSEEIEDLDLVDEIIFAEKAEVELPTENPIFENPIEDVAVPDLRDDIFAQIENDEDLKTENLALNTSTQENDEQKLVDEDSFTDDALEIDTTILDEILEDNPVSDNQTAEPIFTQNEESEDQVDESILEEVLNESSALDNSIKSKLTDNIFAKNEIVGKVTNQVQAEEVSETTEVETVSEEISSENHIEEITASALDDIFAKNEIVEEVISQVQAEEVSESTEVETVSEEIASENQIEEITASTLEDDIFAQNDFTDSIANESPSSNNSPEEIEENSELDKPSPGATISDFVREVQALHFPPKPKAKASTGLSQDEQVPVDEPNPATKAPAEPIPIYISKEIRKRRGEIVDEPHHDQMPLPNFDPLAIYKGMVRRFFIINRHTIGLFAGGLIAFRNALPKSRTKGLRFMGTRISAGFVKLFVAKDLRNKPFAFQLRRRLELMGPTYIKLGQILALREDILPSAVTDELKNLLDRLPEIPFNDIKAIIEADLGASINTLFKDIDRKPIGTASIAQTHFATTINDERVVLKVVKPGIRDSILTDIRLLKLVSGFLQWAIPQYQPKQLIVEFCAYTEKEVYLTNEADHAEIFAANFVEMPEVKFPKIYREYSGDDVLCMEFMDGFKPGAAPQTEELTLEERETLVENGAAAIIQMLYKDGFFHADLHPGNLMVMKGPQLGFIDLGMVGRFEDKTRRRMLYYFHSLVTGDIEGATKYLLSMARIGQGGDPQGFRRAVADILRRYYMHSKQGDFSLGQLILNSLSVGGKYRVFFPVEMTLMVKALVTFEGVGLLLLPRLDIPGLSKKYVTKIFRDQFNPAAITRELMRGAPELVDMLIQLPKISADSLKFVEESINDRSPSNPLQGVKSAIIAGACLIGGVLALIQGGHWGVYSILFALSVLFAMFGK